MVKQQEHLTAIAKNTGLGMGGKIFFIISRLVIVILITRSIGAEQYGIFVLAMGLVTFLEAGSLLGLQTGMIKFISEYNALGDTTNVRGTIYYGIAASLITSLFLSVFCFLTADIISNTVFHKPELATAFRIMLLGVPFGAVMLVMLSALQGIKLVRYSILVQQILMPVFRLICVSVALFFGYKLIGITWSWVIITMFGFVAAFIFLTRSVTGIFNMPFTMQRKGVLSFSIPLLFSQLLYQNINTLGLLIVGIFMPVAQVGIYNIANRATALILIPLFSYNAIFSPIITDLFTKGKKEELESLFKTGSRWVLTLTLPLIAIMFFYSKDIVLIFGSDFSDSGKILVILLIGQIINVGTGSTAQMLTMTGKPLYNLFNSGVSCFLNIGLTLFLVKNYGIIGAAWAQTISITILQLLQMGEVWYFYKLHPFNIQYVKPIVSVVLSSLLIYLLGGYIPIENRTMLVVVLSAISLLTYAIFVFISGLSEEDSMILGKIQKKFVAVKARG